MCASNDISLDYLLFILLMVDRFDEQHFMMFGWYQNEKHVTWSMISAVKIESMRVNLSFIFHFGILQFYAFVNGLKCFKYFGLLILFNACELVCI